MGSGEGGGRRPGRLAGRATAGRHFSICFDMLRYAAMCCDVLRCAAMCCDVPAGRPADIFRYFSICFDILRYASICFDMLRCAAMCGDMPAGRRAGRDPEARPKGGTPEGRGDLFLKRPRDSTKPATPQTPLLHKPRYSTNPATPSPRGEVF